MEKLSNPLLKTLGYLGGAAAGGGIAYELGKGLDYNPIEKILSIGSGIIGGTALPHMMMDAKSKIPKALALKLGVAAMILGEAAPATIRSIRGTIETQKAQKELNKTIKGWAAPALIGGGIGLGTLGITAIPALANISRAADRIGDGKSIRMSTSIRKRPNDPSDLKLVVMSPDQADKEQQEYIEQQQLQQQ